MPGVIFTEAGWPVGPNIVDGVTVVLVSGIAYSSTILVNDARNESRPGVSTGSSARRDSTAEMIGLVSTTPPDFLAALKSTFASLRNFDVNALP